MLRNLTFYFNKISQEERRIAEIEDSLRRQQHLLEAEKAAIATQNRNQDVIDLIEQESEDENLDHALTHFNRLGIRRKWNQLLESYKLLMQHLEYGNRDQ